LFLPSFIIKKAKKKIQPLSISPMLLLRFFLLLNLTFIVVGQGYIVAIRLQLVKTQQQLDLI